MSSQKIKPCPFCGEEGITVHEGSTFRWVVAECNECGATCGEVRMQTSGAGTRAEWLAASAESAIAEWNRRHE